ncbi:MAG: arsenical pump-driving ATPase [Rubripirellula sp.]
MKFLEHPTRILFFTGKGGVGKTSMACAAAVQLADRGLRVLLVSTDPASNLDEVLSTSLGSDPTSIDRVPNLFAMNLDPEASAREYRERMVGPYRGVLPEAAIKSMEEQFSGSCTLEIASFDEFSRLLGDKDATKEFDHVIFDTAPTGHTLRLLTLPSAWTGFIETNTTGTSCLGPLAGLEDQKRVYQQTVTALSDPETTTLVLVTQARSSALREAARTSLELKTLGVSNQHLIVNGVFTTETLSDPIAVKMQARGQTAVESMPAEIQGLERTTVPLMAAGLMGVEALRNIGNESEVHALAEDGPSSIECSLPSGLGALIDDLAGAQRGVILAMGKGGVGKTTVASAIAVALAERGFKVHLSTTDPAAHITATMAAESLSGLTVGRIDPVQETKDYTSNVLRTAGADLDASGIALLQEDLRSPCTEEIAVFRAFAQAVSEGSDGFVVLDTAPTGHTILLLDSALAYHREVTRQTHQMPESVQQLLPRLRDPNHTRVLLVTLPAATPVHEAAQLQKDLRRAEIEPYAWIINESLVPLDVRDPILCQRKLHELPFISEVRDSLASRVALIPWQTEIPTGLDGLRRVIDSNSKVVG